MEEKHLLDALRTCDAIDKYVAEVRARCLYGLSRSDVHREIEIESMRVTAALVRGRASHLEWITHQLSLGECESEKS